MISQKELVKGIAEALEVKMTEKNIKSVLDTAGELIAATIKDDEVKIFNGLSICAKERAARVARNPQNGELIEVPAKLVPKAKFGKYFKDAVN